MSRTIKCAAVLPLDDFSRARSVAELQRRARNLGVTYQFCNFPMPDTMELFGREVLPHLGVA